MPLRGPGTFELFLGDGSDGNLIVSGAVGLTRDSYYNTLVLSASTSVVPFLATNSFKLFVKNKIWFVTSGTIDNSGISSTNGSATLPPVGTLGSPTRGGSGTIFTTPEQPPSTDSYGGSGGALVRRAILDWVSVSVSGTFAGNTNYMSGVAGNRFSSSFIMVGNGTTGSRSTDGGATWTQFVLQASPTVNRSYDSPSIMQGNNRYVTFTNYADAFNQGGVTQYRTNSAVYSDDNGASWLGTSPTFAGSVGSNPRYGNCAFGSGNFGSAFIVLGVNNDSRISRSSDGSSGWSHVGYHTPYVNSGTLTHIAYSNNIFVCIGYSGAFSTDGGISWQNLTGAAGGFPVGGRWTAFGSNASGVFIAGKDGGIAYRTTNVTGAWNLISDMAVGTGSIVAIRSMGGGLWFCGTYGADTASYSVDDGVTWTRLTSIGVNRGVNDIAGYTSNPQGTATFIAVGFNDVGRGAVGRNFPISQSAGATSPTSNISGAIRNLSTLTGITFMSASGYSINGAVGGVGGTGNGTVTGSAGGMGGGVLFIAAREIIATGSNVVATFSAKGGDAARVNAAGVIPGSGGGGGVIVMMKGKRTGSFVWNVSGGLGGANSQGVSGSSGAPGVVYAFDI